RAGRARCQGQAQEGLGARRGRGRRGVGLLCHVARSKRGGSPDGGPPFLFQRTRFSLPGEEKRYKLPQVSLTHTKSSGTIFRNDGGKGGAGTLRQAAIGTAAARGGTHDEVGTDSAHC